MHKRGFTLIELLVVISIIAILSGIIIASLSTSKQKGRDAKRIADLKSIQVALSLYYNDNNKYPLVGGGTNLGTVLVTGGYLSSMPKDPTGSAYFYAPYGSGSGFVNCSNANTPPVKYHLAAALEVTTPPDDDVGNAITGYSVCNGYSASDPNGTTIDCSAGGSPPAQCYDITY